MAVTKKAKKVTKKPAAKGSETISQKKKKSEKASKKAEKPSSKAKKSAGKQAKGKPAASSSKRDSKGKTQEKAKKEKQDGSIVLDAVGMDDVPISVSEADRDLMSEVMPEVGVSAEDAIEGDAAEAEARAMDLDEVATAAD